MAGVKVLVAGCVVALVMSIAGVAAAKPLTEAQWKKQGNKICKQVNEDINAIGNEVFADLGPNDQPSDEQVTTFVQQLLPALEDAIVSINKLDEPKSLRKAIKKFNSEVGKVIVKLDTNPLILLTNRDPFKTADKAALAIGLKACASNSG